MLWRWAEEPQAKECRWPLEAGEAKEGDPPPEPPGETGPAHVVALAPGI